MRARLALLLITTLAITAQAHASCGTPLTLDRMATDAHEIVLGRCVDVRTDWNEARTLIQTDATYEIERRIKGAADPKRVTVRSIGGTVGRITQWAVGSPRFTVGRRDLLFLVTLPEGGPPRVFGLGHGQMPVRHDARGRALVRMPSRPGRGVNEQPLDAVVRTVRAAAAARPGARP